MMIYAALVMAQLASGDVLPGPFKTRFSGEIAPWTAYTSQVLPAEAYADAEVYDMISGDRVATAQSPWIGGEARFEILVTRAGLYAARARTCFAADNCSDWTWSYDDPPEDANSGSYVYAILAPPGPIVLE